MSKPWELIRSREERDGARKTEADAKSSDHYWPDLSDLVRQPDIVVKKSDDARKPHAHIPPLKKQAHPPADRSSTTAQLPGSRSITKIYEREIDRSGSPEPQEPQRSIRLLTDDDDMDRVDPVVPSMLGCRVMTRGGIGVIAGASGAGKTLLLTNLSYSLATGTDFLGLGVHEPVRVLFMEVEGNRTVFKERRRTLRQALGMPDKVPNLYLVHPHDSFPRIGSAELSRLITEYRIDVVFFDTINFFHTGDENSASHWKNNIIAPLRTLAREIPWQPAFWMTTHFSKPSETRQGGDRVRGTSGIVADSSTTLTLEKKSDDAMLLTFTKIKDGPPLPPQALHVDWHTGVITAADTHPALLDPRMSKVRLAVGDQQVTHTKLVTTIMAELKVSKTTAKSLIATAMDAEVLTKDGKLYSATQNENTSHEVGGSE